MFRICACAYTLFCRGGAVDSKDWFQLFSDPPAEHAAPAPPLLHYAQPQPQFVYVHGHAAAPLQPMQAIPHVPQYIQQQPYQQPSYHQPPQQPQYQQPQPHYQQTIAYAPQPAYVTPHSAPVPVIMAHAPAPSAAIGTGQPVVGQILQVGCGRASRGGEGNTHSAGRLPGARKDEMRAEGGWRERAKEMESSQPLAHSLCNPTPPSSLPAVSPPAPSP